MPKRSDRIAETNPADDFMWDVAYHVGRQDLTHNAEFQAFCANTYGSISAEQAAEEWERR